MTTEIGENFLLYTITKEIWDATRDTLSNSENIAQLFHVESILHNLRQGNQPVTTYFTTDKLLAAAGLIRDPRLEMPRGQRLFKKIMETKRIFKFLMGLDKSLDEVRGRILWSKPIPSLREVLFEV